MRSRPVRVDDEFRKIVEAHRQRLMRERREFVSFREATALIAKSMNTKRVVYGKKWRR